MKITKSKKKLNIPVIPMGVDISFDTAKKMEKFVKRNGQNWLGLASNQVGLPGRVICAKIGGEWIYFINPVLTNKSKETGFSLESCLSVPNKQISVERHVSVTITAWNYYLSNTALPKPDSDYDYDKKRNELELTGQDAFVVQHEIDHLDGILMTDRKEKGLKPVIKIDLSDIVNKIKRKEG